MIKTDSLMVEVRWILGDLAANNKGGTNQKKIFYDILPLETESEGYRMKTNLRQDNQWKKCAGELDK